MIQLALNARPAVPLTTQRATSDHHDLNAAGFRDAPPSRPSRHRTEALNLQRMKHENLHWQTLRRWRLVMASGGIDVSVEPSEQIYWDSRNKRCTTQCLQRRPLLLEDVAEISV